MTCDKTNLQQGDDMDFLIQVSDEALEAMRGVNARISNSCLWILLLHLSPSSALRITFDALMPETTNRRSWI